MVWLLVALLGVIMFIIMYIDVSTRLKKIRTTKKSEKVSLEKFHKRECVLCGNIFYQKIITGGCVCDRCRK